MHYITNSVLAPLQSSCSEPADRTRSDLDDHHELQATTVVMPPPDHDSKSSSGGDHGEGIVDRRHDDGQILDTPDPRR